MPILGAHTSTAGGLHHAIAEAVELGCQTVQLFTKNANQWAAKPLADLDVLRFRDALRDSGLVDATAHDSYLINLASPDEAMRAKSIAAFTVELERAEALGLRYLVMHPGATLKASEEEALTRVVDAFDQIHERCPDFHVQVLIETTAGQGTTLGHRFEHLATILAGVRHPERLGVCLDTCHIFAAGYGLWPIETYEQTFAEFDRIIGLSQLRLFHVNDSLKAFGSRVDRHAGIGLGAIGIEPFRRLVNDPRFHHLPMILETPKTAEDGTAMDPVNLACLRQMIAISEGDRIRDAG